MENHNKVYAFIQSCLFFLSMEYPFWFFFTVWLTTSTIASKEWVQVPIIGHKPKGGEVKKMQVPQGVSTLQTVLGTKAPVSATQRPLNPSKVPPSTTNVPPRSSKPTSTPPTSQKLDAPEALDFPELRIEPGLPADEFMRAHETLSSYGKGSVQEKVHFLGHLKKQLLRKAAELMPRAIVALGGRSAATTTEGRGHKGIGFPSSEGTLMSLCFLVFAVFLVKIVIQLIQGLQNNSLGVVTGAVRTARSDWDKAHTEEELLRLLESLQHRKRAWVQS